MLITKHRHLPITTVAQTLLDFAAVAAPGRLRHALAEADFRRLMNFTDMDAILVRGHAGTGALRSALHDHSPDLARTRSDLERRFVALCAAGGIDPPEVNVKVAGLSVDMLWREHRVIVELDGVDGHVSRAQVQRDRERDLRLRAAGYVVLRYTWQQITRQAEQVIADLIAALQMDRR